MTKVMAPLPRRNRWILGLVCLCLLTTVLGPVRTVAQTSTTPSTPLTLDEYVALVTAAKARLDAGSLAEAQALFAAEEQVILPAQYTISVVSPLAGLTGKAGLAVARTRLALLLDQLALTASDRTAARLAMLREVLSRPEFTGEESWLLRWLREFFEWLRSLLPDLPNVELPASAVPVLPPAPVVNWMVVGVVSTLAVVLLAVLLRWGVRSWLRSRMEEGAAGDDLGDQPATPEEARAQAVAFAAEGNLRAAVRRLYLAALLTLQQREVVSSDASLTNLELLEKLRTEDPVRPLLAPVVTTFDEVWYGNAEPDAGHFRHYEEQVDALAAGIPQVDGAADGTHRQEAP